MLPDTATRVSRNTADEINRRIARETEESVEHHSRQPQEIDHRLRQLDREWDIERTLEANAAALAFSGVLLGAFVDRRFLILPGLVTAFLLQHALQGWCPPVPFFRKHGVRTTSEIDRERYALKALRGDFETVRTAADGPGERARQAFEAARV